jgi:L-lysine 6-transaminase
MEIHPRTIAPADVRATLNRHILADGMPMVLSMDQSDGRMLVDAETGRGFLDLFGFYASSALGMNHPKLRSDAAFMDRLMDAAVNKVANSDVYTPHFARFVDTFSRVGIPDYLPHAFFISGGALAVENALKAAFDWKVRKNFAKGYREEKGHKVLHFDHAFHGRTGYTLSLTNTVPGKTMYFPKFDWPRVSTPMVVHKGGKPTDECDLMGREARALAQIKQAFATHRDDIACILVEPIQGEGGDNHLRPEFLQAVKDLAHENDALMIFDEVQTGVGITGDFWAHQTLGVEPDILAFGKKTQVCGILAGRKIEEVDGHVFETSSRINSTWGGNLVDMVRFDRILEIIEEDDLVAHSGQMGRYLVERLLHLEEQFPQFYNVRGQGLFAAFSTPDAHTRNALLEACFDMGVVVLGCGGDSIRFRPPLTITKSEIDQGIDVITEAARKVLG